MRVLVTGGHGFIGSHLVPLLLEQGAEVRCLYRREGTPPALAGLDVEIVRGDLRARASLADAVRGVDEVHHLAGLTSSLSRRAMFETNAVGTRRLLEAAADAGLTGRFVLCSSMAAVGPGGAGGVLEEASPRRPITAYGASKARAEDHARERAGEVPITILRPPGVYGPRDYAFVSLFQAAAKGISVLAGRQDKRYSLIHAEDLARAFVAAARSANTLGGCYFTAHPEVVTLLDMVAAAEEAVGRRTRHISLPESAMRLVGGLGDLVAQWTGRSSVLGAERMQELVAGDWVCSVTPFLEATSWRATTGLVDGFRSTAAWYRAEGALR